MKISRYFDSAVLKPNMSEQEVKDAIRMSIDCDSYSVCVRPCDIELAVEMCKGTNTVVSCVLDFPHGDSSAEGKAALAEIYAAKGVAEIDMVMFGRDVHPTSYIISVVITLVFALIVTLVMHRHLKKVDMVEALKSVE